MISIRIDISPDGRKCWVYDDKGKLLYPHFERFVGEVTTTQFMQRVIAIIVKEIMIEDW